jgi:anti-anti-sigma factor
MNAAGGVAARIVSLPVMMAMKLTTAGDGAPDDGAATSATSDAVAAVRRTGAGMRVEVAGDIDAVTVDILRDSLDRAAAERPNRLEVDLSGVTFVGSAGIGALAAARQSVGALILVGANHQIRRILTKFGVAIEPAAG